MLMQSIRLVLQVCAFAAFVVFIGYFSASPSYTHMDPEMALIRLSFSHAGAPVRPCRRRTQEELARLAPNMRKPTDCPRERVALLVEVEVNGERVYREHLAPTGLHGDGSSTAYSRFPVEPGRHRLTARLRDTPRETGFDHEREWEVELRPGQSLVIDFQAETGGFKLL